jgi:hypothetical protein
MTGPLSRSLASVAVEEEEITLLRRRKRSIYRSIR